MLQSLDVIVLSKLKYGDNDLIFKCYSKQKGLVSFFAKNILKRKKGNVRVSLFQPLGLLTIESSLRPNQNLHNVREVKINKVYHSLNTNIYKGAIAMFLSEVLTSTLKEEEPNAQLFEYLETSFQWLDHDNDFSNFHLLFLLNFTKYLGFYPKFSQHKLPYFNLSSGTFSDVKYDNYTINGKDLTVLYALKGTNFDTVKTIKLNSNQRHSFLSMLLLYFELHLGDFKQPKSLEVLNKVFS
ncbi:DNA repair protein RecO [Ichthyenterobacterium sp. W332]|uniref:DNA repair protein RecO n=1 Tax=Microcosmobacter mediterraneus TaxID=3075607 RepID=A0ABU2YIT5_9FLAO|nr:DNA repair protein RecO [Ichthyenterobacterium sp. W332]MDT0557801.1 DNA repair protein RecO [Ichthyenterobacterium sp. W332]